MMKVSSEEGLHSHWHFATSPFSLLYVLFGRIFGFTSLDRVLDILLRTSGTTVAYEVRCITGFHQRLGTRSVIIVREPANTNRSHSRFQEINVSSTLFYYRTCHYYDPYPLRIIHVQSGNLSQVVSSCIWEDKHIKEDMLETIMGPQYT